MYDRLRVTQQDMGEEIEPVPGRRLLRRFSRPGPVLELIVYSLQ